MATQPAIQVEDSGASKKSKSKPKTSKDKSPKIQKSLKKSTPPIQSVTDLTQGLSFGIDSQTYYDLPESGKQLIRANYVTTVAFSIKKDSEKETQNKASSTDSQATKSLKRPLLKRVPKSPQLSPIKESQLIIIDDDEGDIKDEPISTKRPKFTSPTQAGGPPKNVTTTSDPSVDRAVNSSRSQYKTPVQEQSELHVDLSLDPPVPQIVVSDNFVPQMQLVT